MGCTTHNGRTFSSPANQLDSLAWRPISSRIELHPQQGERLLDSGLWRTQTPADDDVVGPLTSRSLRCHQRQLAGVIRAIAAGVTSARDILAAVTPGGGKSLLPVLAATRLIEAGMVERIIWVVPRDSLRLQAEEAFADPVWRATLGHSLSVRAGMNASRPSRQTRPRAAASRRARRRGQGPPTGGSAPRHRGCRVRQDQHASPSRRPPDRQRRRSAPYSADDLLPPVCDRDGPPGRAHRLASCGAAGA